MYLVVIMLVVLFVQPAWGQIAFDNAASMSGNTSASGSVTIAATASIALVCVAERDTNASGFTANASVTVGGAAATLLDSSQSTNGLMRVNLFYRLVPATGNVTVNVTADTGTDLTVAGVVTYTGVASTSTFNSTLTIQNDSSINIDANGLPSAVGELMVLCGGVKTSTSLPSPDATSPVSIERLDALYTNGLSVRGFFYDEAGASPTGDVRVDLDLAETWAAVAVSLRLASAGARNRGGLWLP